MRGFAALLVPARESGEEEEADESEDYCDDAGDLLVVALESWEIVEDLHQVWEDNRVFELTCEPDEVQRVLVHAHLVC